MSEDSLSACQASEGAANLDMDSLKDLDFDVIEDMPWAQELWKKVEKNNKKGFLNWCAIVKKVAGTKEDNIYEWNKQYLKSVDEVLIDMVTEMSKIHSSTIDKLQDLLTRLQKACIELHQPMPQIKEEGLSLYEAQIQLMKYVKEYEVVIDAKKKDIDNLNKKQTELCKDLDLEPQINLKYPPLPTQAQFDNMKDYIGKLESEKFEREEKYINFKSEIIEIAQEIKYKPSSDFERKVLSLDHNMILSSDNLKKIEFFAKCLKDLKISTEKEISHLRTKIEDLWKMLDIDLMDRDEFRTHYTGSSLDIQEALKVEVMRCEEMRKANIKKFVEKLRLELQSVWQKCHCSDSDRSSFKLFYTDCYTEDLLDLHEIEIQKWQQYYNENSTLLEMLNKHQEFWNKMIQFEENASGINRFKNRGGQLLQEEKERNKLSKVIPQLEEKIMTLSEEFFNRHNKLFMTFGKTAQEYIQQLHDDRENNRKMKLSARKMQRNETTVHTPGKSAACLFPSTSKCVSVTPKTLSTIKRKILATPNTENTAKKIKTNTPASLLPKTKGTARLTPKVVPKIMVTHATLPHKKRWSSSLKEKQRRKRSGRKSKGGKKHEPNETRDTTYTEFQRDLSNRDKGRSTILASELTAVPTPLTNKKTPKTPTYKTPAKTPSTSRTPSLKTPTSGT